MFAVIRLWRRIGGWRGIAAEALLAWRLLLDKRVPFRTKLILPAAVLFIISPINLPFQFIPIVGEVDDLGIILLALTLFLKACPDELKEEHAQRLEAEFTAGRRGMGRMVRPSFDRWTRPDRQRGTTGSNAA